MKPTNQYPLSWPAGWKRHATKSASKFGKRTLEQAVSFLMAELRRMRCSGIIISSNLRYRNDGFPYSGQSNPQDPGIAVYFSKHRNWPEKNVQMVMACDTYRSHIDNVYAIAKTVEAMRTIDRYGVDDGERAFAGFEQLPPAPSLQKIKRDWWIVLGVSRTSSYEEAKVAFKHLALTHHPDRGGTQEAFTEIQAALDECEAATTERARA